MKQVELKVVAHACNPNYIGGRNQEDQSLRQALTKS
jgi:hypothetical protein